MADFVYKPSANAVDDFTGSLEFNTLNPAGTVSVADGTYDIYVKVVSSFQVVDISAQFSVADVGEEPVIDAVDGNVSVTIGAGPYAAGSPYTTRTDGAPLTVAMIEAGATPVVRPVISGTVAQGNTLTVRPGLWLYAGDDPGDQTWQQQLDGTDIPGGTGLEFVVAESSFGKTLTVEETFGGVTIETDPLAMPPVVVNAGLNALFANGEAGFYVDVSDTSTLFTDTAGTTQVVADGDLVARVNLKGGSSNFFVQATSGGRPVYRTNGTQHWLEFDATKSMALNSAMDFSATDTLDFGVALLKKSNVAKMVLELTPTTNINSGAVYLVAGQDVSGEYNGGATGSIQATGGHFGRTFDGLAPDNATIIVQNSIPGDTSTLYRNGVVGGTVGTADKGTGNFANDIVYLGSRGGTTLKLNGDIYGFFMVGRTITGSERTTLVEPYLDGLRP